MARLEWVELRLRNWALWKEREASGGLGFATASIFANGPAARGTALEARVPVDEIEASITNEAVESLRLAGQGHLYKTLHLYYVRDLGIKETARAMDRAESTIHAQLERADLLIAEWLRERQERILLRGLVVAARSMQVSDIASQRPSPALVAHFGKREQVREELKAARALDKAARQAAKEAGKGRRRVESVRTSEAAPAQPAEPRKRSRPVLTLRKVG